MELFKTYDKKHNLLIKHFEEQSNNKPKTEVTINIMYSKLLFTGSSLKAIFVIIKKDNETKQRTNLTRKLK